MRVVVVGCLAIIAVIMAVPQLHLRGNFLGAFLIVLFSFLFVTVSFAIDRRDWFVFDSDFRDDCGDIVAHVPGVFDCVLDGCSVLRHSALDRWNRLHRCI